MSLQVFADSFFYLGLLNPNDEYHERVYEWSTSYRGPAVTTEAALLELGDAFCEPGQRDVLLRLIRELRSDALVDIVALTPSLIERAWDLFAERADKRWGITDCVSFVVMKDKGLTDALTGDQHFVQAGFHAIFA